MAALVRLIRGVVVMGGLCDGICNAISERLKGRTGGRGLSSTSPPRWWVGRGFTTPHPRDGGWVGEGVCSPLSLRACDESVGRGLGEGSQGEEARSVGVEKQGVDRVGTRFRDD